MLKDAAVLDLALPLYMKLSAQHLELPCENLQRDTDRPSLSVCERSLRLLDQYVLIRLHQPGISTKVSDRKEAILRLTTTNVCALGLARKAASSTF